MPGRGRLRGGVERLLPDHRSSDGKAMRRDFGVVVKALGIDDADPLLAREAWRWSFLTVRSRESARAWADAVEKRRSGRGRRPSPRVVERLARRAALDDSTATQALDRLRDLAGKRRRDADPLEAVKRAVEAANR